MLRRVIEDAGLVNHVRQMLWMPRRKSIMPPRLDVEQFVERIPIRQPGGAFLIGDKQVAVAVERHPDGEANAAANRLARREIRTDPLNGAPLRRSAIARLAG